MTEQIYNPRDLPNRTGFQFVAHLRDGSAIRAEVVKDGSGCYTVKGVAYCDIVGWAKLAEKENGKSKQNNAHV